MNKLVIIGLVALVVLGGTFYFVSMTGQPTKTEGIEKIEQEPEGITPETSEPAEYNIDMLDYTFIPSTKKIKVGDTIVWINKDVTGHSITSVDDDELDSGLIEKDDNYLHTFNEPGEFEYHSTAWPSMTARIIVEE